MAKREHGEESAVPGLDWGLCVIEWLSARPEGVIAYDLARRFGVPRNSMSRVLQTLEARGWVIVDPLTNRYHLTRKLFNLACGNPRELDLITAAADPLRAMRDACGETVTLAVRFDTEGVILDQAASPQPVRVVVDPGVRFPLHATAPGKTLLAFLPPAEREALLKDLPLPRLTKATLTSVAGLRRDLDEIRARGWALDLQENLNGVHCICEPVFDGTGACVATLTVVGLMLRLDEKRLIQLQPVLRQHAEAVSAKLGWPGTRSWDRTTDRLKGGRK